MAETIVKVPQDTNADYDFIAFSFKGKHSLEDFGIYRVSDGNRYNDNILPPINDITAENTGDGQFYFGSVHKPKVFNISFAFDDMSEQKYREMRQWLNGKEMGDLWFAEAPYKVYTAKVTGQPLMKTVCFEESKQRKYKGEGSVQFTAFWPYAHTPDYIQAGNEKLAPTAGNYRRYFSNYGQWGNSVVLPTTNVYRNNGDVPAPFVAKLGNIRNQVTDETATYVFTFLEPANDSNERYIIGITLRSGFDGTVYPASNVSSYKITKVGGMNDKQQLEEVDFSNLTHIKTLDDNTFSNCYKLKNVVLPDTVSYIGSGAFYNCQKLNDISIPDQVSTINKLCFYNCGFDKVTFGDASKLTEIKTYAFQRSEISEIVIPNNVTKIGKHAFSYTQNLSKVIMPRSIKEIDDRAFYYNGSEPHKKAQLVLDFSNASLVPILASRETIIYEEYCNSIIIVPDDLYETWINATNWSLLKDQIKKQSVYYKKTG